MIGADSYYIKHEEPCRGALLVLRQYILASDSCIAEKRRYQIPFFYYKEWRLCFLWVKQKKIILGIISDYRLFNSTDTVAKRDGMHMITIDPSEDFDIETIIRELNEQIATYKNILGED